MRLSDYIQRTRALGDAVVPTDFIRSLEERMKGGADLATLLRKRSAKLPAPVILGVWRAYARVVQHDAQIRTLMKARILAKQPQLTVAVLKNTVAPHDLIAAARAEELAPVGSGAEHRRRDAIKEGVALWNACLALTRKEGTFVATCDDTRPEAFKDFAVPTALGDVDRKTWLQLRAAERDGSITITLNLPKARFVAQVQARGAELSALAHGRSAEDLVEALVLGDIVEWAKKLKDEEAQLFLLRDATHAYFAQLTQAAPKGNVFAGVWQRDDMVSVAVIDAKGDELHRGDAPCGDGLVQAVEGLLGGHPVEAVILSEAASKALSDGFGPALPILTGLSAGLDGADAALHLAQRVVAPLKYLGATDPLTLGLHDPLLDPDRARTLLGEMTILAQAGVKADELSMKPPSPKRAKVKDKVQPLNPALKSVDDLRPGMTVNGLVTNITQFGAFVNIGLSHEGLVHVSELADHFVSDPKEVVTVGQAVQARVLGVDRGRRRISLSLRPERAVPAPARWGDGPPADHKSDGSGTRLDDIPGRGGRRRGGGGPDRSRSGFGGNNPRQPATGGNRQQALADLEALFKK